MTIRHVGNHVEITEQDVRAGQTGVHLRYILIVSTLLLVAGLGSAAILSLW